MIKKLKGTSEKVRRAQILLKANADGPAWTDEKIADAFNCRVQTVESIRQCLVLEVYERPHDPDYSCFCMDEQPVRSLKETRVPIKATKTHAQRVDYEYERNGTASIFMFAEPLAGSRHATDRRQRTKVDWALEVAHLLDTRYADCEWITLVLDNLNTHTKGAFYEAFPAEQARTYVRRN